MSTFPAWWFTIGTGKTRSGPHGRHFWPASSRQGAESRVARLASWGWTDIRVVARGDEELEALMKAVKERRGEVYTPPPPRRDPEERRRPRGA